MNSKRIVIRIAIVLALGLALGVSRVARTDDLDLLSSGVPPNLVVIFDTSGSMQTVLMHDEYYGTMHDPDGAGALAALPAINVFWPSVCGIPRAADIDDSRCPGSTYLVGNAVDGNTTLADDPCPSNDNPDVRNSGTTTTGCGPFTLPNYHSLGTTWWPNNYLNWLLPRLIDADPNNNTYPNEVRMDAGKDALTSVINIMNPNVVDDPNDTSPTYTENVRMGLARYNSDNGGYLVRGVANGNKALMLTSITALPTTGRTPLNETLVDVGRYFAGPRRLCDPSDNTPCYTQYNLNTSGSTIASPFAGVPVTPVDSICRKNFVVFMTDGAPTQDNHEASYQNNFETIVGNWDLDGNECDPEVGPQPRTCYQDPDDGRDDGLVYADSGTDYLDDVAKFLYDYDLNTTTSFPGVQNIVTYTIGFSVAHPLLQEAAADGHGEYFTATNATALADSLEDAIGAIINQATSFTAASVPSSRTSFDESFYTAYFMPTELESPWAGHLQAFTLAGNGDVLDKDGAPALDPTTDQFVEPRNPHWDAGTQLADANHPARNLYTTLAGARDALANATEADLAIVSGEEPSYPNYPASGVTDTATLRTAILDFLAGLDSFDQDDDSNATEKRLTVLGDIFHASPVVVGPPSTFLLSEDGYGSSSTSDDPFVTEWAHRDRVVYAGANDGMLHAFDAGSFTSGDDPNSTPVENGYFTKGSGNELFGYVPGQLLSTVKMVPRNFTHLNYYVDGPAVIADAWLGDPNDPADVTKTPDEWATVLVTGFRQGGSGYLALDVTNPAAASSSDPHGPYPKLLWEFSHSHLGNSWSEAVITRVKVRAGTGTGDHCGDDDGDGDCREQWVAIFGGGYADTGNPNHASFDATALPGKSVFMVELETGTVLANLLYDPNASDGSQNLDYAIPSQPAVLDLDFDGFADVVYIGDLGGQLWKWDIALPGEDADSNGLLDSWDFGVFFNAGSQNMGGGIFHYRSLFFPPAASFVAGKLVLAFGSGERTNLLYAGAVGVDDNNRFYVVKDNDPTGTNAFVGVPNDAGDVNDITGLDSDTVPGDLGFYFKLGEGEKFVTNQIVFAGYVIAATYVPTGSTSCDQVGSSRLYIFSVTSGLGFYFSAGVTTGDAARRISIGSGAPSDPRLSLSSDGQQLFIQTSTGQVVEVDPPDPGGLENTIYWRHVN